MLVRILALFSICCACGSDSVAPKPADARDEVFEEAGRADSAGKNQAASGPLVAFLGDSIVAGLHLAADEAFPAVLARRFAERGRAFRLINAGSSGRTSAGGLAALDWLLAQEPDFLVLALGGNDGLRGQPIATIEANLVAILERAQARGVRVLLLGVRLPPNYGEAYRTAFDALYPALAKRFGVPFVPYYMEGVGGVPEQNLPDGLHPTAAGQRRLADKVEPALWELVGEAAATEADASPGAQVVR